MSTNTLESDRQRRAFEYYYSLGESRSYNRTASYIGVSSVTIKKWADNNDWANRVIERDNLTVTEALNKKDTELIVEMEANRKLIRASLADFIKRLKSGEIKVNRIKDAVDLMKLDKEYVEFIIALKDKINNNEDVNVDDMMSFSLDVNNEDDEDNTEDDIDNNTSVENNEQNKN